MHAQGCLLERKRYAEEVIRTVEAVIDEHGIVRLLQDIRLPASRRAIVTILEDDASPVETALLSEMALAEDWSRPEEEAAWAHFQQEP